MADVAAFWQKGPEEAEKCDERYLERIIKYKHLDLLLIISLCLSFGILFIFSATYINSYSSR